MRELELRLALVCYGGISLAVYMHGITKEIWHVLRASCDHHGDIQAAAGTDNVYRTLIEEMAERAGTDLRVLVDVIAGASAGGINGIFLGQAIATGQSLEPLTELWLSGADVEALIDAEAAPASRFSKVWALPLAWMAAGRSAEALDTVEEATRDEVRAKLSHFVRSRWFEPPFSGTVFVNMLLDAFDAMAAAPIGPRLLPAGQPLDLFVTVTDFTGHPERLRLHSPPEVVETEHRVILSFGDRGMPCDTLADAAELTFAARATSSFPGAFPPFTVAELDKALAARERAWPGRDAFLARALPRHAAARTADRAALIDGSVLANAPFRPAIDALTARPARRPVDRRFLYIDPSPGARFGMGGTAKDSPGFFQTILGAISELPRQQPIRDNLEAIAARSGRIERLREIVTALRPTVDGEIDGLFGRTLFLDRPTSARLAGWRRRAQGAAADRAGYGYAAYAHLKLARITDFVVDLLAGIDGRAAPPRERLRAKVTEALAAAGVDPAPGSDGEDAAIAFLRGFDLPFRIRRLRLLSRRLGEMNEADATLMPLREAIFASLTDYLAIRDGNAHVALRPIVRSARAPAAELLERLGASLDLARHDAETDARLAEALAAMPREVRRPMLLSYLGFPFFDIATLPLLQGEGLDEFDPIKVDRLAPEDARSIRAGGAEATLKGIQFNKFGAFFSRAYRENDYLWGRLHGAERMIDILLSALPPERGLRAGQVAAIKRRAFLAILEEEAGRLTHVAPLFESLRREIG